MIRIDLANIDSDGVDCEGVEPPSFLDINDPDGLLVCENETNYELHAALVNSGILVSGRVATVVRITCGKCLEDYELEVENNEICRFYEDVSGNDLDMTEDIREEMLVSLPQKYICNEDCKGLCPICGANLNTTQCECKKEPLPEANPWEALNSLNIKDNSDKSSHK